MSPRIFISGVFFFVFWMTGSAFANREANFIPPNSSTSVLQISISKSEEALTFENFEVEVDGIDVTSTVMAEGNTLSYQPVEPFTVGSHVVRLLESDNSEIYEIGRWTFEISGATGDAQSRTLPSETQIAAAEKALKSTYFRMDTLTELSQRLVDREGQNEPDRTIASGAGDANAGLETKRIRVSSHANYLLQSDRNLALTGNILDLGEYDVAVEYNGNTAKGAVNLGHHDAGINSLLMSNFYRRGASVRLGTQDDRVSAQGFAFGTESLAGISNFTGLTSSNERLAGGSVSVKPFSTVPGALSVTGTYYRGTGNTSGVGVSDFDPAATGSGWGLVITKGFDEQRTRLRGEYAWTSYDADGDSGAADDNESDALRLYLDRRVFAVPPIILGNSFDISVGAGYDRIGAYFASLANPGMAADRNAVSAYGNLNWGSFSSDLRLLHETNNVDGLSALPTDRLISGTVDLSYNFDPQTGDRAWLGTPYISLNGYAAGLDRLKTPAGYAGAGTDNLSTSLSVGGGASYDDWYWGLTQSLSTFEDHTNQSSDTVSYLSGVNAGWTVSPHLNLDGGLQFGGFTDKDTNQTGYTTNLNFAMSNQVVPDVLDWNLDYNLNLLSGSGDTPVSHVVNSEIEWTFLQPRPNHAGLALAVRGSMENVNGNADNTQDGTEYQVFVVLRIKAPFDFGN